MTCKTLLVYSMFPDTTEMYLLEGDYSRFHEVFTNGEAKPGLAEEEYEKLCDELESLYDNCWSKLPPTDARVLAHRDDARDLPARTFMLNNFERVKVVQCGFLL